MKYVTPTHAHVCVRTHTHTHTHTHIYIYNHTVLLPEQKQRDMVSFLYYPLSMFFKKFSRRTKVDIFFPMYVSSHEEAFSADKE